eukprot:1559567-Amphidinium_carterae.1
MHVHNFGHKWVTNSMNAHCGYSVLRSLMQSSSPIPIRLPLWVTVLRREYSKISFMVQRPGRSTRTTSEMAQSQTERSTTLHDNVSCYGHEHISINPGNDLSLNCAAPHLPSQAFEPHAFFHAPCWLCGDLLPSAAKRTSPTTSF